MIEPHIKSLLISRGTNFSETEVPVTFNFHVKEMFTFLHSENQKTHNTRCRDASAAQTRFFLINVVINVRLSVNMTEEELGLVQHP